MLILWIGLSAALFCLYEQEWGYLTSVYFFFVSISAPDYNSKPQLNGSGYKKADEIRNTVGLGDIVPGNKDMMLGYFLLILIGLALLSMCINLIQVVLERILGQLLQEYIDEIERVAAIAKNEVDFRTEGAPFEMGMATAHQNGHNRPFNHLHARCYGRLDHSPIKVSTSCSKFLLVTHMVCWAGEEI
ncbi:unnamed protein product [Gongylonema pulchrum]|uniref:Ion_trans_2 domain-containing protein n=1 Tax=Gongylonema pulchrum TaxID=637853 RepID=A0A183D3X6_9BILA|nr:unnamed protein product [Gongylonema pulchrum]